MQIKSTITLDISPENAGLFPIVANKLGFEAWRTSLPVIESGIELTVENFIIQYLNNTFKQQMVGMISPAVDTYFGDVMKANAEAVKGQLATALVAVTEITN